MSDAARDSSSGPRTAPPAGHSARPLGRDAQNERAPALDSLATGPTRLICLPGSGEGAAVYVPDLLEVTAVAPRPHASKTRAVLRLHHDEGAQGIHIAAVLLENTGVQQSSSSLPHAVPPTPEIAQSGTAVELRCPFEGVKRKGGWPKGKKRKPARDDTSLRAPTTGYMLFLNAQRKHLKAQHPALPFTEIMRMLGTRWSQLPSQDKQKYMEEAEEDKRRYVAELRAYQDSEIYQAFLKRRASDEDPPDTTRDNGTSSPLSKVEADESEDLHCRTCRQYFSSLHNKREHLYGRQHLLNLTGELEKDTTEEVHRQHGEDEDNAEDNKGEENYEGTPGKKKESSIQESRLPEQPPRSDLYSSLNLPLLQANILKQVHLRALEVSQLREALQSACREQDDHQRELQQMQVRQGCLQRFLEDERGRSALLTARLQSLQRVPSLLTVHPPDKGEKNATAPGLKHISSTSLS